ncbi:MAG: cell division protein ZapB, partial [Bacteroidota bacterium]
VKADGTSFTVTGWNSSFTQPEKVFVYGEEVNDFRQVDYDKIHNLNVSATQELARRVAELEAANAGLMEKNNKLQQQNEGLRGDVNGLSDRLNKLENLLMSNGKR